MKIVFTPSLIAALTYALLSLPALSIDQGDITAGLNTLPLLLTRISGDTTMAIIYDPANAASRTDAEKIKKIIDNGIPVPGGGRLSGILVGVNELGKLSRARIALLLPGLAPYFEDVGTAASAASILTFTTDIACVRAGKCIIGIVTQPDITIYFSKSAADNAKIEFSQAFSMVVKQP